jgi:prepilin-type N-terminal cleavage/methylation domain-containing protein
MQSTQRRRPGFTVVELLVVVSIIAVLAALGAGAYIRLAANARKKFTEDTIARLASQLQTQVAAVADRANTEPVPPAVLAAAGNDPVRARAIYVKMRLKQEFPQSFAEARDGVPGFLPPLPGYVTQIAGKSGKPEEWAVQESAVMLMLSLSRMRSGLAAFDPTQHISAAAMRDIPIDGGSMKVFVDGFGNPIVFTRWPGAWKGDASLAAEMNTITKRPADKRDPSDPEGRLNGFKLVGKLALALAPYIAPEGGDTRNLMPVIWSPGPDGKYGVLVEDLTTVNEPEGRDNIYSFRLRKDGQRGD